MAGKLSTAIGACSRSSRRNSTVVPEEFVFQTRGKKLLSLRLSPGLPLKSAALEGG